MNKTEYCLTLNGKKVGIVKSLEEAIQHIAGSAIDIVKGEYVEGKYVGALISYDVHGNKYSVCRVSKSVANIVTINQKKRWEKRHKEWLKKQNG